MLKYFPLLIALVITSCAPINFDRNTSTGKSNKVNTSSLKMVVSQSINNIDNANIYSNPNDYMGKVIDTKGVFLYQEYWKNKDKSFVIRGVNNFSNAEFIVNLDHPLATQNTINEGKALISKFDRIIVIGRLKGFDEVLSTEGVKQKLPVLEAIAIYKIDDNAFDYPLWVSLMYQD